MAKRTIEFEVDVPAGFEIAGCQHGMGWASVA